MPDEQDPSQEKSAYNISNKLIQLSNSGFDLTQPRLLLHPIIRQNSLRELVTLVYCDDNPPEYQWYQSFFDDRFIRVHNQLITSILFTGKVTSPGHEWTHCLLSFVTVPPLKKAPGYTLYAPLDASLTNGNSPEEEGEEECRENLNVNVQACWMHHLDVYMFMRECVEITECDEELQELP